jgi:uncharacterized protein YwbE
MPAAVTLYRNRVVNEAGTVQAQVKVVLSGTYPTGGEPIDFSQLAIAGVHSGAVPIVSIQSANGLWYGWVPGTDIKTGKLKCGVEAAVATNTVPAEHTSVTYVAGYSGDTIVLNVTFPQYAAF